MAEPPRKSSSDSPSEGDATAAPESTVSKAELRRLNEELRRLNAELYRGERGFRTLADNVPALFSYIDAEQRYRYVNRGYREFWNRPAEEIVGTTVTELLGPEGYALARPHIDRVLAGEQVTYQSAFAYADGPHAMQVSYVPDRDDQGKVRGFFALIDDITPLKRAEEALLERESRLRAIMDTAPNAIITIDRQGAILSFNRAAEATFGYSAAEAIGSNVTLLMPSPYCEEHDGYIERYHRTREPHMIGKRREVRGQRRDGSVFPLEVTVTEVDGLDLYVGIVRDLSAQRRLEQEVTEASTYEQERIGQEIHDGLGQKLTALSLLAMSLKRELTRNGNPESPVLNELIEHLQDATGDARALSRGLVPVPLTEEGLADALRKFAAETQEAIDVVCEFEAEPLYPLELEHRATAVQLYRIAQEAVHNAVRHARPRRITIRMGMAGRCPELSVRDDGRGFTSANDELEGFGLRIMRYRAGIIGGELRIDSEPGEGTLVRCKLPPLEPG